MICAVLRGCAFAFISVGLFLFCRQAWRQWRDEFVPWDGSCETCGAAPDEPCRSSFDMPPHDRA